MVAIFRAAGTALVAFALLPAERPAQRPAAVVAGVVEAVDGGGPIAGALVVIDTGGVVRSTTTDGRGAFLFREVPAGETTLRAVKHGFASGAYGSLRPGRPGTALVIADGQRHDVVIRLSKAVAIGGVVRGESGEPEVGVFVFALDAHDATVVIEPRPGARSTAPVARTDDRGRYRLYDLWPGEYVVVAIAPREPASLGIDAPGESGIDAIMSRLRSASSGSGALRSPADAPSNAPSVLPPTFYPGTWQRANAVPVRVAAGEDRQGIDITMRRVRTAVIDGRVLGNPATADSIVSVEMGIASDAPVGGFALSNAEPRLVQRPDADGVFRFADVIPGRYWVGAQARLGMRAATGRGQGAGADTSALAFGLIEVNVGEGGAAGVVIPLAPGVPVGGRVQADGASGRLPAANRIRLTLSPHRAPFGWLLGGTARPISPSADGTFTLGSVAPGAYKIGVTTADGAGERWWALSAMHGDVDVLDVPLTVDAGAPPVDLQITLTRLETGVHGTIRTATSVPVTDCDVIVFPSDRQFWQPDSRRVRSTRPATDGSYSFRELPAGQYLIAAVLDAEPGVWNQPESLRRIVTSAMPVVVTAGNRTRQDLQAGPRLQPPATQSRRERLAPLNPRQRRERARADLRRARNDDDDEECEPVAGAGERADVGARADEDDERHPPDLA